MGLGGFLESAGKTMFAPILAVDDMIGSPIQSGVKSVYNKVKGVTDVKPVDYARVEQAQSGMKESQNWLKGLYETAGNRAAPQVAAPQAIDRSGVRNVSVGGIQAPTVSQTQIDPQAYSMMRDAAMGLAPSAAQGLMRQGMQQAASQSLGMAGTRGGYNPAAIRLAQRQMSSAGQDIAGQSAVLAAQEAATARGQFGEIATQQAQLAAAAKQFNATMEGQVAMANAENSLKAQLANQGVDLDLVKTNAARGDQFALANLEVQLRQSGMNDAMQLAYIASILGIDEQLLATEMARVGIEQQRHMLDTQTRTQILQSGIKAAGDVAAKASTVPAGGA